MKKYSKGFTLIEIIVSLAIFSIVAVVALGALTKIISANNKAQTLQSAITNLNYAMESISREMRVGRTFYCSTSEPTGNTITNQDCNDGILGSDIGNGSVYIAFRSSKISTAGVSSGNTYCNLYVIYKFDNSSSTNNGISKWQQSTCDESHISGTYSPIIDENVKLSDYFVKVSGPLKLTVGPLRYPVITMRISGYTGAREKEKTYFDLQSSVYARVLDTN